MYDLERPGCSEIVTTDELRSGLWGAWEERIWSNSGIVQTGKPVWTGVTNDVYKLTKLVMRRIPAGSFKMGYADSADVGKGAPNIAQRDIMLTKPYYMGVFPVTRKQLRLMTGSTNQDSLNYPTVSDTFDQIRGAYTTAGGPYDWPTDKTVDPNSFIGKFRARTGAALDLPTEAQWEKAARAGSAGVYYDGCEQTHMAERNAIAWNTSNAGATIHSVGQLKPNNYGLYDVLGNCWEWVLDWMAGAVDIELTDPEGPTAAGAGYWSENVPKRMLKGAAYTCDYRRVTLYERTQNPVNAGAPDYGWRLALPAK